MSKTTTRNIPEEMANLAIERGEGVSRAELKRAGFSEEQIDAFSDQAAVIAAERATRRVA